MNRQQFTDLILIPMLREIPRGYSYRSRMMIAMIIAHESDGGEYIKQLDNGPALGIIQMEPYTHACTWENGHSIWANALICGIITQKELNLGIHPKASRLIYDLRYNVFMARQRLFMKPEAFPSTRLKMSAYLKRHWNTAEGSAHDLSYLNALDNWS